MNKNYTKPVIVMNNDVTEGVYLASGCYTTSAYIHQSPDHGGAGTYRIQVDGKHEADHTKEAQLLMFTFNQPVTYGGSNGTLVSGSGTTTLTISYGYHQNPTDNIGLGDVIVESEAGLAVTGVKITD